VQRLFSYGTLQYENVQLDTFGRTLKGEENVLLGYRINKIEIKDPIVLASSNETHHPILNYTGKKSDKVNGVIFEVTKEELLKADTYEEENYKRVLEVFESGQKAWVYIASTEGTKFLETQSK